MCAWPQRLEPIWLVAQELRATVTKRPNWHLYSNRQPRNTTMFCTIHHHLGTLIDCKTWRWTECISKWSTIGSRLSNNKNTLRHKAHRSPVAACSKHRRVGPNVGHTYIYEELPACSPNLRMARVGIFIGWALMMGTGTRSIKTKQTVAYEHCLRALYAGLLLSHYLRNILHDFSPCNGSRRLGTKFMHQILHKIGMSRKLKHCEKNRNYWTHTQAGVHEESHTSWCVTWRPYHHLHI